MRNIDDCFFSALQATKKNAFSYDAQVRIMFAKYCISFVRFPVSFLAYLCFRDKFSLNDPALLREKSSGWSFPL